MRALSSILKDLIAVGEAVASRPLSIIGLSDAIDGVHREIIAADALPAEGERATRGGVALALALRELKSEKAGTRTGVLWLAAIGVLLPLAREDLQREFINERETRS